jgi:hypothetical protein
MCISDFAYVLAMEIVEVQLVLVDDVSRGFSRLSRETYFEHGLSVANEQAG